mgnify:CR=1 FL=1
MSKTPPNLANLPPEMQALCAAQATELGRKDAEMLGLSLTHAAAQKRLKAEMASVGAALSAERHAHARAIQNRDTIIADLRLQLHGHKKHRFGSKSESSAQLALELVLEELEIEQAAETDNEDEPSEVTAPPRTPRASRAGARCGAARAAASPRGRRQGPSSAPSPWPGRSTRLASSYGSREITYVY